jgi:membrane associated rhomboid family serine protease
MATDLGPPHDRVRLSPAERRAIATLEQSLASERGLAGRVSARLGRAGRALGRRLVRIAPALLPLGILMTLAATSTSSIAGALSALVTGLLLALTCWRVLLGAMRRRARRLESRRPRT